MNGGSRRSKKAIFWAGFFGALLLANSPASAEDQLKVVVIKSSSLEAYEKAWQGFKAYFGEKNVTIFSSGFNLEDKASAAQLRATDLNKTDLVLVLGTKALGYVKEKVPQSPVVFSMVVRADAGSPALSGVSMNIPADMKFETLRKIVPDAKRIGIIYSPDSVKEMEQIQQICSQLNMKLVAKEIPSEKELPEALKDLAWRIDSFLMIPDPKIYSPHSVEYVLLEGLRNKFSVVGLSSFYTKAGALISFDCDYADLGRQSADLAVKVLNGEGPFLVFPRKVKYSLNLLTAERLGISIPEKVLSEAGEVFGR
jgi:putative tryptophan/tyrosine transport system substrate-binding protein